jgi:hypothetical protein
MSDLRFLSYTNLACIFVALAVLKRLMSSKSAHPAAPLPPGPKGLPILGNLLDMPSHSMWETYSNWGKKYGTQKVNQYIIAGKYLKRSRFTIR